MIPKKKNPYETAKATELGRAPRAESKPAQARAARPAAAPVAPVAPVAPAALVAPSTPAAPAAAVVSAPTEAPAEVASVDAQLDALRAMLGMAADKVSSGLIKLQQQTGVSVEALAALMNHPHHNEADGARALQILLGAGLATAGGLTARGQVLKQKVLAVTQKAVKID
jgi:hypothetical protein